MVSNARPGTSDSCARRAKKRWRKVGDRVGGREKEGVSVVLRARQDCRSKVHLAIVMTI